MAQVYLARFYYNEHGIEKNYDLVFGQFYLGDCNKLGVGADVNEFKAFKKNGIRNQPNRVTAMHKIVWAFFIMVWE